MKAIIQKGGEMMLNEISIEVIRQCPNNCLHCSSSSNTNCSEMMPLDKFKEVVSDAVKLGAKSICLSGGEPFQHTDILELVKYVHEKNLNCYIYTSGIILDKSGKPSALPVQLINSISEYVTKLIFNVEAASESTYDLIMGTKNCFTKLQESIKRTVEASIIVEAHFVPMKLNYHEIDAVVELCIQLKVSRISFLRLVLHGRAKINKEVLQLSNEEYKLVKDKLQVLKNQSQLNIRIGVPLSDNNPCVKCEAACGKLNIKYDGKVFPCEVFKNFALFEKVFDCHPTSVYEESLENIYYHSQYLQCVRDISQTYSRTASNDLCVGQYLMSNKMEDLKNE